MARTEESLFCWQCTQLFKQVSSFSGQLNLCSVKSHGRQEGWECQLLITSRLHLERGSPGWTWLKIISKSKFPQHHIIFHYFHPSSLLPAPTPPSLQTEGSAEDVPVMCASQIVHHLVERQPDPGMSQGTTGKVMDAFLVKVNRELGQRTLTLHLLASSWNEILNTSAFSGAQNLAIFPTLHKLLKLTKPPFLSYKMEIITFVSPIVLSIKWNNTCNATTYSSCHIVNTLWMLVHFPKLWKCRNSKGKNIYLLPPWPVGKYVVLMPQPWAGLIC